MNRRNSCKYFHVSPENLNCAQAILKGFQKEFNISDTKIEEYRVCEGGRADGGMCGALFAAECIIRQVEKEICY